MPHKSIGWGHYIDRRCRLSDIRRSFLLMIGWDRRSPRCELGAARSIRVILAVPGRKSGLGSGLGRGGCCTLPAQMADLTSCVEKALPKLSVQLETGHLVDHKMHSACYLSWR
jgi:hypothetical protein